MTSGGLGGEVTLDAQQIRACLEELADRLEAMGVEQPVTVAIAGGSCLALIGLRDTTVDVDAVTPLSELLEVAVRDVAKNRGLREWWLNARALAWLLLMKLNRSTEADIADMRLLWPRCTYTTAADVVAAFYRAYPDEEVDEYLADHVRSVLGLTG